MGSSPVPCAGLVVMSFVFSRYEHLPQRDDESPTTHANHVLIERAGPGTDLERAIDIRRPTSETHVSNWFWQIEIVRRKLWHPEGYGFSSRISAFLKPVAQSSYGPHGCVAKDF